MICANCGAEMQDGAMFCLDCGQRVSDAASGVESGSEGGAEAAGEVLGPEGGELDGENSGESGSENADMDADDNASRDADENASWDAGAIAGEDSGGSASGDGEIADEGGGKIAGESASGGDGEVASEDAEGSAVEDADAQAERAGAQAESQAEPQTVFCEICGAEMPADAVFCGICGNAVGAAAEPQLASLSQTAQTEQLPLPREFSPTQSELSQPESSKSYQWPMPQRQPQSPDAQEQAVPMLLQQPWPPEAQPDQWPEQPQQPWPLEAQAQGGGRAPAADIPASPARAAASAALGALLSLSVCALLLLFVARSLANGGINDAVQRMDLSKVAENSGIAEIIYDNIGTTTRDLFDIDAEGIAELFQRGGFPESIGGALAKYVEALVAGNARYSLSSRDVQRILKSNASAIRLQFGYVLVDEDFSKMAAYFDEYGILDEYSIGALVSEYRGPMSMLYAMLSLQALIAAGGVCLMLMFDILIVNLRRVRSALLACGIAIGAAGALYAALSLLAPQLGALIGGRAGRLAIEAAKGLGGAVLYTGLAALAVGVLAVAAFCVINAVKKTAGARRLPSRTIPAIAVNVATPLCCGALLFLGMGGMPQGTGTLAELRERRPPVTTPASTTEPGGAVATTTPAGRGQPIFEGGFFGRSRGGGATTTAAATATTAAPVATTAAQAEWNSGGGATMAADLPYLYTGDTFTFGGYEWLVLDRWDDRALVISRYIIDLRAYEDVNDVATWEQCSLRQWLNGEFYESFGYADQEQILERALVNDDNPWYGTDGGNDTYDKIFLLSLDEVVYCFGDSGTFRNWNGYDWDFSDQYNDNRMTTYNGQPLYWWLRSPGDYGSTATMVGSGGDVSVNGWDIRNDGAGIRPAFWLDLSY